MKIFLASAFEIAILKVLKNKPEASGDMAICIFAYRIEFPGERPCGDAWAGTCVFSSSPGFLFFGGESCEVQWNAATKSLCTD